MYLQESFSKRVSNICIWTHWIRSIYTEKALSWVRKFVPPGVFKWEISILRFMQTNGLKKELWGYSTFVFEYAEYGCRNAFKE